MKEVMIENSKKKKQEKKKEAEKKPITQIQQGERLGDFVRRVEEEYRSDMVSAHKGNKTITERKKKNQLARKEKLKAKKQKIVDKYGGKDFDDLKDSVKFGDVVDAPPIFNKLPKARGQGKRELEAKTNELLKKRKLDNDNNDNGYESEEDENMKILKASHKRKLANMSAAAKKVLDDEREKAILSYREKKSKKMMESGLTPAYKL
ncbi:unnamed protein product [Cunninghamella blakesleeana]